MMTYELLGKPFVESEYSDEWETVMVCNVRRSDGVEGDVWIVAGVRDYQRGSSTAAGTQAGYQGVRVFGDSPSHWCPDSLRPEDGDYSSVADAIVEAVSEAALGVHNDADAAEDGRGDVD